MYTFPLSNFGITFKNEVLFSPYGIRIIITLLLRVNNHCHFHLKGHFHGNETSSSYSEPQVISFLRVYNNYLKAMGRPLWRRIDSVKLGSPETAENRPLSAMIEFI